MEDRFKFRVWDKENNKMFTPPRHFNYSNVNGTIVCIESFCQYDGFYQKRIIKEFNDATLMQCTGLRDKNGKLIYEGDILASQFNDYIYQVFYGNYNLAYTKEKVNCIGFYVKYNSTDTEQNIDSFAELNLANLEVIGNIYENADLLKEGKE